MNYIKKFLFIIISCIIIFSNFCFSMDNLNLTIDEKKYLDDNRDKKMILGVYAYSGTSYFKCNNKEKGYMMHLIKRLEQDLNINIEMKVSESWDEIYNWLQDGTIDILYGANKTKERETFMSFTSPILVEPYNILTMGDSEIYTVGDLDKKKVGFLKNDFIIKDMKSLYSNINYKKFEFESNADAINSLRNKEIDTYIISGSSIIYDYLYKYPDLKYVSRIQKLNTENTLSMRKENEKFVSILDKEINLLRNDFLANILKESEIDYNLKVMNLSAKEMHWLKKDGIVKIGIVKDYVPFDYYDNGKYMGINGRIIQEISKITGIKFVFKYDYFYKLKEDLQSGYIDMLNMSKTEDREKFIFYSNSYISEKDVIYGRKESSEVKDIYGLDGKSVAIVKGAWQEELLRKNSLNVKLIKTLNVKDSIDLLQRGKVDYIIENPTVLNFYVENLQYYDLVQKGDTSSNSFFHFGISKSKPELVGVVNKVLPMIDMFDSKVKGIEDIPRKNYAKNYKTLLFITALLSFFLITIIIYTRKIFNDFIKEKTEKELFRQREYLFSIDVLTNLYNRNYFNTKIIDSLNEMGFPQTYIVSDLNNLKIINDLYGHQTGDALIKAFAEILKQECPTSSHIVRMGGDEFLIILENSNEDTAQNIINKIKKVAKEKNIISLNNINIKLEYAIGYAIRYSTSDKFEDIFHKADMNMYLDKNNNKNRKCFK